MFSCRPKPARALAAALALLGITYSAHADLILHLADSGNTDANGNAIVSFLVDGTLTINSDPAGIDNQNGAQNFLMLLGASPQWGLPGAIDDFMKTGADFNDLALSDSIILSHTPNALPTEELASFESISLDREAGADSFSLDAQPPPATKYPGGTSAPSGTVLGIGSVISWSGSGTFTLSGTNNAYGDVFNQGL